MDSGKEASRTAQVAFALFATERRPGVMIWSRYSTRLCKKKHFLSFNLTPASPENCEHLIDLFEVLLLCARKDHDIIDVDEADIPTPARYNNI